MMTFENKHFLDLKLLRKKIRKDVSVLRIDERRYFCSVDTAFGSGVIVHDNKNIYQFSIEPFANSIVGDLENREPEDYMSLGLSPYGTDFQLMVWNALVDLSFEREIFSYKDVAEYIELPRAARAVGNAVSKNPIAYLVPCHRVVRSNGTLGGFAWGVELKKRMLAYDKAI